MNRKIGRTACMTIATLCLGLGVLASPASASDPGCYTVDTPDGDVGVCNVGGPGSVQEPVTVGSMCVGSTCTPEKNGTVEVFVPTLYCTLNLIC